MSHFRNQVEGEGSLTCCDMGRQVKLGDQKDYFLAIEIDLKVMGKGRHAFPEMDAPLADNVV